MAAAFCREGKLQTREFLIAVTGSQAEKVRSILVATRNRLDAHDKEKGTFRFKEVITEDPARALEGKKLDLYLEGLTPQQAKAIKDKEAAEKAAQAGQSKRKTEAKSEVGNREWEAEKALSEAYATGAPIIRILLFSCR